MRKLCVAAILAVMLVGCADTGPVAPKEGRISIGNRANRLVVEEDTLSVSPSAVVKNWSALYANERNNRLHVKMVQNPKLTHTVSIGQGVADSALTLAGPVVVGNTIYTLDGDFVLQATDLKSTKSLWRKKVADIQNTSVKSISLTRNRDRLYAVAGNGLIIATDFKGNKIWEKDLKSILRSSATVDNGRLYVSSVDNHFFVLDIQKGDILWDYEEKSITTNFFGVGTPAVFETVVVVPTTNGRVNAFDTATGVMLWTDNMWTGKTNNPLLDMTHITAAPVIENKTVYLVGNAGKTGAYRLSDGTPLFTLGVGGRETPVVSGDALFLLSNQNKLMALNKQRGSKYWEADLSAIGKGRTWFGPVLVNGELVLTSSEGDIVFFDAKTGKEVRREKQDKLIGAPVFAKNTMLLLTTKGDMLFYQ